MKHEIKPFYVGQKVVAIKDHSNKRFLRGQEFTVTGIINGCCDMSKWVITIGIADISIESCKCLYCGKAKPVINELIFNSTCFAPTSNNFKSISYTEVMEKEQTLVSAN